MRGTAHDDHGTCAAHVLVAAQRCLPQRTGPEEGHDFAAVVELVPAVAFLQRLDRDAAHDFHQAGGHAHGDGAHAQHDHLGHRCRQRQHQAEGTATALFGVGFDTAAQRVHFGAHHVHADAAAGHARHFGGRAEARLEDQTASVFHGHELLGRPQLQANRLGTNALQIQARAIILDRQRHIVALLAQNDFDRADDGLALGLALFGRLDAVGHAVTQQMFEGRHHAFQHAAVHFDGAAQNVQAHLLAHLLGGLAHHGVQTLGKRVELHHARAQQIALQITRLTALSHQVIFGSRQIALQIALHGGHVVDRLGHHAGQLLHAGEAVELQRVKACRRVLGQGQTRLHLALCLHLDIAQLGAQTLQVAGQVIECSTRLVQARVHTRAGNQHFAGLRNQAVQQLRTHTHGLLRSGTRHHGRGHLNGHARCLGLCQGLGFCRSGFCTAQVQRHLGQRVLDLVQWQLGLLLAGHAQHIKAGLQRVEAAQQRLDGIGHRPFVVHTLHRRFQAVGHFAHAHGAGQAGAALERVQRAQCFVARLFQRRTAMPTAQRSTQLGQQVHGFFFKDGEQVRIDLIQHIDIVLIVGGMNGQGNGLVDATLQLGLLVHAAAAGNQRIRRLQSHRIGGIEHLIGSHIRQSLWLWLDLLHSL